MRTPTAEQQAVLDSLARIRVVRAAPGSGKTTLVGMLIRRKLDDWPADGQGIAALSFTRVGGQEIRKELGYDLGHPHVVGTIDAFLFRHVIRPFIRLCFPAFGEPRLVPAEWGAERWGSYGANLKASVAQGINLFGCVLIDEKDGRAVIAHKPHPAQPLCILTGSDLDAVREGKKRQWKQGWLTHSDAAYWASSVLAHEQLGHVVRAAVIRRFSLVIVDELQDTGYYLGKSIRLLLDEQSARGVLVGDPNQAIFEFNGAKPSLFSDFEALSGAVVLPALSWVEGFLGIAS